MTNKIIILHTSDIVRSGILAIVKKQWNIETIDMESIESLSGFNSIKESNLIFLADARLESETFRTVTATFRSKNRVKIVLIHESVKGIKCPKNCDCCFSLDDSTEKILNLIKPFIVLKRQKEDKNKSSGLTDREIDVVGLVAYGKTNKEIAEKLCISVHTVISHRKNITEKLGIKSISGLTVFAILNNFIDANSINREDLI